MNPLPYRAVLVNAMIAGRSQQVFVRTLSDAQEWAEIQLAKVDRTQFPAPQIAVYHTTEKLAKLIELVEPK